MHLDVLLAQQMGNEVLFVLLLAKQWFDPRSGATSAALGQGRSGNRGALSHPNDGAAKGSWAAESEPGSVTGGEK